MKINHTNNKRLPTIPAREKSTPWCHSKAIADRFQRRAYLCVHHRSTYSLHPSKTYECELPRLMWLLERKYQDVHVPPDKAAGTCAASLSRLCLEISSCSTKRKWKKYTLRNQSCAIISKPREQYPRSVRALYISPLLLIAPSGLPLACPECSRKT